MSEKVYTIKEFCIHYRISDQLFYSLLRKKIAPKILKIGARTLITEEAAKEWEKNNERN
jgi:hypothetical protein